MGRLFLLQLAVCTAHSHNHHVIKDLSLIYCMWLCFFSGRFFCHLYCWSVCNFYSQQLFWSCSSQRDSFAYNSCDTHFHAGSSAFYQQLFFEWQPINRGGYLFFFRSWGLTLWNFQSSGRSQEVIGSNLRVKQDMLIGIHTPSGVWFLCHCL